MGKKKYVLSLFLLIMMATIVSAVGFFGESILHSSFTYNPENALTEDLNFAVPGYSNSTSFFFCPPGNFNKNWTSHFCEFQDEQKNKTYSTRGWFAIDFRVNQTNGTGPDNVTKIRASGSELNLGCTDCNNSAYYRLFFTSNYSGSGTTWEHIKKCNIANDEVDDRCSEPLANRSVEVVVVARTDASDNRPDPAINWVKLIV